MTKEIIESKIKTLNNRISEIENRPTEVYSRIVGYYRSVKNWNNGKSAEYKVRKTFMEPDIQPCQPPILNTVKKEEPQVEPQLVPTTEDASGVEDAAIEAAVAVDVALEKAVKSPEVETKSQDNQADLFSLQGEEKREVNAEEIGSYLFFFRNTCPNCPPMKDFLAFQEWKGSHINVDEEEGLNAAVENNVFTAPTVILLSQGGSEIFRSDNVAAMKEFIESGEKALSAV